MINRKILVLFMVVGLAFNAIMLSAEGQQQGSQAAASSWPNHPITLVVGYSAGGGTDTVMRALAKSMEKPLGVTINVVNRPGAIASLATDFVSSKPANGYWWLATTQYNSALRAYGYSKEVTWKDWQFFQAANSLESWSVVPNSPIKSMAQFLSEVKANPGKYKVSNSGVGGTWFLGNEILEQQGGYNFRQVPYNGGAPAVLAALNGEVDVVASGLHEQISDIRAGKLRNLAVFTKDPIKLANGSELKPITDFVPSVADYAPFGGQYNIALKRGVPSAILKKISDAIEVAAKSPEFLALLKKHFIFPNVVVGQQADRQAAFQESVNAWFLWDLKVQGVKNNPADLGIPKPANFKSWWPPAGYKPAF